MSSGFPFPTRTGRNASIGRPWSCRREASRTATAGDVPVRDLKRGGLPVASIVRTAKLATIEANGADGLGALSPASLAAVLEKIQRELGV